MEHIRDILARVIDKIYEPINWPEANNQELLNRIPDNGIVPIEAEEILRSLRD